MEKPVGTNPGNAWAEPRGGDVSAPVVGSAEPGRAASDGKAQGEQSLELAEALDLEAYFLDTTCVKLHIHFPVDWVLLRDAARTLMKATMLIRKRDLKVRMEEPAEFLKRMNQLCMKMTHARRKKDGKRVRKAVLREMKKLSKTIAGHAGRHRELLERRWQETDLREGEARQIVERIGSVLAQLPAAIRQAHERIIGERQVNNLSLIHISEPTRLGMISY